MEHDQAYCDFREGDTEVFRRTELYGSRSWSCDYYVKGQGSTEVIRIRFRPDIDSIKGDDYKYLAEVRVGNINLDHQSPEAWDSFEAAMADAKSFVAAAMADDAAYLRAKNSALDAERELEKAQREAHEQRRLDATEEVGHERAAKLIKDWVKRVKASSLDTHLVILRERVSEKDREFRFEKQGNRVLIFERNMGQLNRDRLQNIVAESDAAHVRDTDLGTR